MPGPLAPEQQRGYGRQIFNALRFTLTQATRLAVAAGVAVGALSSDTERSARLVFSEELRVGVVHRHDLARPEVVSALASRPVPPAPVRALQRAAMKTGSFDFERRGLAPLAAARRTVLGPAAAGPPRFLVRVDEFPQAGAYDESERARVRFDRFHSILAEAEVPYLMAVTPRVARDYLDPAAGMSRPLSDVELATLGQLRRDGVTFAQHGLDHRTRDPRPRHRSELVGLDRAGLDGLLDRGGALLAEAGLRACAFSPPFNRLEAWQYEHLAERYGVICAGPEAVPLLGFHRTPLWRGQAIYVPAYAPFYGRSDAIAAAIDRAIAARPGLWIPVVLHWSWEADRGFGDLRELARKLTGYARPWSELLAA
jgi:hypothetical protein